MKKILNDAADLINEKPGLFVFILIWSLLLLNLDRIIDITKGVFSDTSQEITIESKNDWPLAFKEIEKTTANAITVNKGFKTEVKGLNGWVISQEDRVNSQAIVYTIDNDEYAIIGGLVDSKGNNLTNKHFELFADAQLDPEETGNEHQGIESNNGGLNKDLTKQLYEQTPAVKLGDGAESLVIVVDMNCPYCKHYYNQIKADQQLLDKYTFSFLPVGMLSQDSVEKAAAFNASTDLEFFESMLNGQQAETNEEAIAVSMQRSMQWQQAGLTAVPLTIFKPGTIEEYSEAGMLDLNRLR